MITVAVGARPARRTPWAFCSPVVNSVTHDPSAGSRLNSVTVTHGPSAGSRLSHHGPHGPPAGTGSTPTRRTTLVRRLARGSTQSQWSLGSTEVPPCGCH
jgi:hypothetical protein